MSDLIVSGFDDAHTAFLSRAALARMQSELSLSGNDFALITWAEGGEVALQEAIDLNAEREVRSTFWEVLVSLLLAPTPSTETDCDPTSSKLAAIGIDSTFRGHLVKQVRTETATLLVLAHGSHMRDQVLGVLRGFQGEVMATELTGDDRETWRNTLLSIQQSDEMN